MNDVLSAHGFSGTIIDRFWTKVQRTDGCWLWTASTNNKGYGVINRGGHANGTVTAHTLSWLIHYGPIPKGKCVLHNCDNRLCVRPDHLFLGTVADNQHDMEVKGRSTHGEKHGRHLLTQAEVQEIRERYVPYQVTQDELAAFYGVSRTTIGAIVRGENWRR